MVEDEVIYLPLSPRETICPFCNLAFWAEHDRCTNCGGRNQTTKRSETNGS